MAPVVRLIVAAATALSGAALAEVGCPPGVPGVAGCNTGLAAEQAAQAEAQKKGQRRRRSAPAPRPAPAPSPTPKPPAPSPKDTSKAITKQIGNANAGDIVKTFKATLDGTAKLLSELASGQKPGPSDIIGIVQGIVGGALAAEMINPLLGVGLSFALSFLGGMFAPSESDIEKICYNEIMKTVPKMIDIAIVKDKMKDVNGMMLDFLDSADFWSGVLDKKHPDLRRDTASRLEDKCDSSKRAVFGYDCWANVTSDSCKTWQKAGSAIPAAILATLHIQSLLELTLAFDRKIDGKQRQAFLQKASDMAKTYWTQLQAARDVFAAGRRASIQAPDFQCKENFVIGFQQCEVVCGLGGAKDTFDNTDLTASCSKPCGRGAHSPDEFYDATCEHANKDVQPWKDSVNFCQAEYKALIEDQISKATDMVNEFGKLVQAFEALELSSLLV